MENEKMVVPSVPNRKFRFAAITLTLAAKGEPGTGVSCPLEFAEKALMAKLLPLGLLKT
jgi:hypothetical protein